ncbi:MAG: type pilus assembly protein PilB [Patescibacteria group bacterium]|nr:type pilus assembly protein PilB [Patescibacteria group bacterium]
MKLSDEQLQSLLVGGKVVGEKEFAEAYKQAQELQQPLSDVIVDKGLTTDGELGKLIAAQLKIPFVELTKQEIPDAALNTIPEEVAKRHHMVSFARDDTTVKIAGSDFSNTLLPQLVAQKTGKKIELYYATEKEITETLLNYRTNFQELFEKLMAGEDSQVITTISNDPPVKKMVDELIHAAFNEHASDIHIEPQESETLVRFRIDGILHDIAVLPKKLHNRIVTRIKVLSGLRTDQHLAAQDGKIKSEVAEERLDLRVSIIPIAEGEKVVMRLLTSQARSYSLEQLGINEKDLQKIKAAASRSYGMILVTGPTGSGKTTTIYSVLKTINTRERNLTSIEDPVEYRIKGANQVQVNDKTNLTFANGLRSLLRQDPDYIFVGEIRDGETAAIAINAALTGHLVFSTLHTNNAAASLPRLYDMKVEPFLVASTVNLIIAQRLVRKICSHCRVSKTVTVQELQQYLSLETIKKHYIPVGQTQEVRIYKGQGCRVCHNTGYQGRIGIYEILEMTKTMRELVSSKAETDQINALALKEGMNTMYDDGIDKITRGLTTIEEILRVTKTEME